MKIAVYGTLKSGFGNSRFIEGSKFLGRGYTKENYSLFVAGIPFVVKSINLYPIQVEVYEITDERKMRAIDNLEGHPTLYKREPVQIYLDGGILTKAEMYFYPEAYLDDYMRLSSDGIYQGTVSSKL